MEGSLGHVYRKRARMEDDDEEEEMDIIILIICFVVAAVAILYVDDDIPCSTADSKKKMRLSSSTSEVSRPSKKADGRKEAEKRGGEMKEVSQTLDKLVTFLEGYIGSKKNGLDAKEVLDVVSKIPDLSESEVYKACSWLVENEKQFRKLKLFADNKKKGYLLSAMPHE